jgi:hypothetical protein
MPGRPVTARAACSDRPGARRRGVGLMAYRGAEVLLRGPERGPHVINRGAHPVCGLLFVLARRGEVTLGLGARLSVGEFLRGGGLALAERVGGRSESADLSIRDCGGFTGGLDLRLELMCEVELASADGRLHLGFELGEAAAWLSGSLLSCGELLGHGGHPPSSGRLDDRRPGGTAVSA